MSGSVVAAVAAGAFTLASVGLTVRLWKDPSRVQRAVGAYMWLPFGENVKRGLVRATATRILALGGATGICVLAATSADGLERPGAAVAIAVIALLALVILSLLVAISILLVNRPRWLVPPHMRGEPGLLGRGGATPPPARRPGRPGAGSRHPPRLAKRK